MKTGRMKATAMWPLLVLVLAGLGFIGAGTTVHAAATPMATFAPLPSLDTQVDKPTAVAEDAQGRVYVAESMNNRVLIFSQGGALLNTLTGLSKPISVAVSSTGRIYVGSAWKGSVTVYGDNLAELFKLGAGDGEFIEPADIDLDAAGQAYIVDKDNNTVRVYDAAGQLVKNIGAPGNSNGQFNHPTSLAIDPVASELVILDHQQIFDLYSRAMIDGARIQFFTFDGTFLRAYAKFGYTMNAGQLVKPQQVTVDGSGRVYVTDSRLQKVMVYDHSNTFLGMIDNGASPLRTTLGLSMSGTGRLYVASLLSGRVDVFGIDNYAAMGLQPMGLAFTATEGGNAPAPQAATLANNGKTELAWTATTTTAWLNLPGTAGTLSPAAVGPVNVEVRPAGLAPGTYQGSIKVTAPGMEELVAVTLTIRPNPLQVSPSGLSFTATTGTTPAAQVLSVSSGSDPLNWTASADQAWLSLSKTTGSTPDTLKVYVNASGLSTGSHGGMITFHNTTNGGSVMAPVILTVSDSTAPPTEPPGLPVPGKGSVKTGGKSWSTIQPLPGVALRGVWGSGRKDILIVGDGGTVLRPDGKKWSTMPSGTSSTLHSVWGSSGNDAHAVGDGGVALHSDGKAWSPVTSGTAETLLDVWGAPAAKVLAVGSEGAILSDNFTGAPYASGAKLRGIWGSSATDLFAVGESGAILRASGASWTPMVSGTNQWLNAVWGSSATDVFAVGEGGTIVHFDGTAWSTMNSGVTVTLHGVFGSAVGDVYAVGDDGLVLHYDGTAWSALFAGGINLRDVWAMNRLVVAVGDDGTILTGEPGGFPWGIINQNITSIAMKKAKMKAEEAKATAQPKGR